MSQIIKLKFDGKEYPVESCQFSFSREVDHYGKKTGGARPGLISVSMESPKESALTQWAGDDAVFKGGEIIFYDATTQKSFKTLSFENAFVVNCSVAGRENMQLGLDLTISAEKLKYEGVSIDAKWPNK